MQWSIVQLFPWYELLLFCCQRKVCLYSVMTFYLFILFILFTVLLLLLIFIYFTHFISFMMLWSLELWHFVLDVAKQYSTFRQYRCPIAGPDRPDSSDVRECWDGRETEECLGRPHRSDSRLHRLSIYISWEPRENAAVDRETTTWTGHPPQDRSLHGGCNSRMQKRDFKWVYVLPVTTACETVLGLGLSEKFMCNTTVAHTVSWTCFLV